MVESIVSTGLAIGCIYALIAIAYNVMFSASRGFSFTAGTLGMVGGILGARVILCLGGAGRLSRKSLDRTLLLMQPLALAFMVQQLAAIEWSPEPQPFPRIFDLPRT